MKQKYDVVTIFSSIAIMTIFIVLTILSDEYIVIGLSTIRNLTLRIFNNFYIFIVIAITVFALALSCSKFGCIRMGKTKPKFGWFSYSSMIFCTAMGSSMIFWPSIEWAEYICSTDVWPFGWKVEEMAKYSLSYSFFHWGIPAWAIYAIGIIPIGYRFYIKKRPGLNLQGACEGILGEKMMNGFPGTIISIIFIVGILGGLTISFVTGTRMSVNFLHELFGVSETFPTYVIFIILLTILFTWSALSGIEKGVLNLSKICIYVSILMLFLVFVGGDTGYIIKETSVSFGYHFQNFFRMLFETKSKSFLNTWTVFYWAWWIGLAPVMWIFIARCSEGRTLRNIILTVIGSGFCADVIFFGVISGNALSLYRDFNWNNLGKGTTPIDLFYNSWNEFSFITDTLKETLPYPKLVLFVWIIGIFFLLVTTMDSSAYTMAAATQIKLEQGQNPEKKLRLLWACMLSIIPICLLKTNAGTSSCISLIIISSIPVVLVVIIALLGSVKWLITDYGHMSRNEIKGEFRV